EGDQVEGDEERKEELDVLRHRRTRLLDAVERRLAGEEVAVGLDRGDPIRDLAALGGPPGRDLASVRGDRGRDLRACALELCRSGLRPASVTPVVRPTAELVRLRAAGETGLAVGEEAALRDLPLEARLLGLRRRDLLLRRSDLGVVGVCDLVRRLVDLRRRRLAQLVVDRA